MAAVIKITITTDGGVDKAKADVSGLGDTAQKAGGGFSSLKEIATGALRQIGTMAIEAGAQAVQAIGSFVSDSISAAGDFEAAVNGLAAVTGDSLTKAGFDMNDVSDKALQLGADTQFSAQQAIEAMTELAKGGVPIKDVMGDATDATLALASAAKLDLANAAEIVSKQLGVWGETGVTASEVSDLLASAANASTVDVDELALGLANVGGTAKTAGVSFEDLTQTMALIAPNFSSAADAGTSLKTFISRLIPTTDKATEMMAALGLATEDGKSKFFDASGAFIGMEQASQLLQDGLAGLSEEEKLTALNTIFGSDAIRAAAAIANAGADGFDAMGQAMTDAGGAAAASAIQNQGFGFAMEQMKGSIETVQIVLGSQLLPVLTSFLNDYITPGINTLMTFAQAVFGSDDAFNKLAPDMQALVTVIDSVAQGFKEGGLLGALNQLIPGIDTVIATIQANLTPILSGLAAMLVAVVVPAFVTWAGAAGAAALATIAALAPVIAPIAAIGAAVGVLVAAWQNDWLGIQTTLTDFWNTTGQPIFNQIVAWLGTNIPAAIQVVTDFWTGTLLPALTQVWDFITNSVIPVITTLVNSTFTALNAGVQGVSDFWTGTLRPALNTVWSFIDTNVIPIVTALANVAFALMKKETEALAALWNNVLKPALDSVWAFIQNNVIPIISALVNNELKKLQDTSQTIADFWNGTLKPALDAVGSLISTTLKPAVDGLNSVLSSLKSWLGDISSAASSVASTIQSVADAINSVSIPDWLEGHSPPPMANWFSDIGQAAQFATVAAAPLVASASGVSGGMSASNNTNYANRSMTYAPTINNYGAASDGLDYAAAVSLAGV